MNTLCLDKFEYSLDVCRKYRDSSLHLHGIQTIWLCPVISKHVFQFRILGFYFVSFPSLVLEFIRLLEFQMSFLFICPNGNAVCLAFSPVLIASFPMSTALTLLHVMLMWRHSAIWYSTTRPTFSSSATSVRNRSPSLMICSRVWICRLEPIFQSINWTRSNCRLHL